MDKFLDRMLVAVQRPDGAAAKALREVRDDQLIPMVKAATPVDKGTARAGWKKGNENLSGDRPSVNVVNPVFYIRFLEYGTLSARKRKLKTTRRKTRLSGRGGIQRQRMLGRTMRKLRAKNAVIVAMQKHFKVMAEQAAREAERGTDFPTPVRV